MRIGFAGTPDFSVATLQALLSWSATQAGACVAGVWTQPDRPAGRGRKLTASPVKACALRHALAVNQPLSLRDPDAQAVLADARLDLLVVVAYGLILPQAVLDMPRLGCVNVHASLLPRWRGAAPIQRAIAAGDLVSGVSIMQMDAGLDTGPVWREACVPVAPSDTGQTLHDTLAKLGARELVAALPAIAAGTAAPRPQDDVFATYARKLSKAEARLDWRRPAAELACAVRAFNPWPVADTLYGGRQLRVWQAQASVPAAADRAAAAPGTVLALTDEGLEVACGSGVLVLQQVQLAGGKPIPAEAFARAHPCIAVQLGS